MILVGRSLGRMETCFGPSTQRCRDPISKHISNPDFACKPFWRKGARWENLRLARRVATRETRSIYLTHTKHSSRAHDSSHLDWCASFLVCILSSRLDRMTATTLSWVANEPATYFRNRMPRAVRDSTTAATLPCGGGGVWCGVCVYVCVCVCVSFRPVSKSPYLARRSQKKNVAWDTYIQWETLLDLVGLVPIFSEKSC